MILRRKLQFLVLLLAPFAIPLIYSVSHSSGKISHWIIFVLALLFVADTLLRVLSFCFFTLPMVPKPAWHSALLTWYVLPLVRRLARVDPEKSTVGVAPLSKVWVQSVFPSQAGFIAEIRVTHDAEVTRWADATGAILRALGLSPDRHRLTVTLARPGVMEWRVRVLDLLKEPVKNLRSGAIALTEDGDPVPFGGFHTLIAGATGSGKGSAIWNIVKNELTSQKPVRLYGIDPKRAELDGPQRALFTAVAYDPADIVAVLGEVYAEMKERQVRYGRDFVQTEEAPKIVLVIDELPSLYGGMNRAQADEARSKLTMILQQGRSAGITVISATQEITKAVVEARGAYGLRVALRLETEADTRLFLGEDAPLLGAEPHRIGVSTPSNGYRYSGTAYMALDGGGEDNGRPHAGFDETPGQSYERVRFPYVSDADLRELSALFPARPR